MRPLTKIAVTPLTLISWALVFPLPALAQTTDQPRVEANVVFGMYSGLALLMDVHYPQKPNGYGVICIPGSGWYAPLGYDARPLKNSPGHMGAPIRLVDAGYTVFIINHRAAPLFRYPAAV